jgi:hypothetical protein
MEIYRGSSLPQTVLDWAAPAVRPLAGLKFPVLWSKLPKRFG